MDNFDKVILLELAYNCRLPYQTIARKLNISSNAVKKRVDKLVEEGVITSFTVDLSLSMFGGDMALLNVTTDGSEDEDEFCDTLGSSQLIGVVGPGSGHSYIAFSTYIGAEGLSELSQFVRSQSCVKEVRIEPILYPKGKKVHYTKSHLRILRYLIKDPRMPVADIGKLTKLAPRTVRRLINEIVEGEGIRLGIMWDLSAGDGIGFLVRVEWRPDKADLPKILHWLNRIPEFYTPILVAIEPTLYASFVASDVSQIDEITKRFKSSDIISKYTTILGKRSRNYPDLRQYKLEELLKGIPI